jgi:hypothetical protein
MIPSFLNFDLFMARTGVLGTLLLISSSVVGQKVEAIYNLLSL